jgi:hypothetical protein
VTYNSKDGDRKTREQTGRMAKGRNGDKTVSMTAGRNADR